MTCDQRIQQLRNSGWRLELKEVRTLTGCNNHDLIGWDVYLSREKQAITTGAPTLWEAIDVALIRLGETDGQILEQSWRFIK